MLISNFKSIADVYKKLKAPLVTIDNNNPNTIIGVYDDFKVLRTMNLIEPAPFLTPGMWLNLGITTKLNLEDTIPVELIEMINGPVLTDNNDNELFYIDVNRELNRKFDELKFQLNNGIYTKQYEGIFNEGEFFEGFNELKASDGASLFKIAPRICLFVYKGLIPYNKGDTVIYNIYCGSTNFIAEFITKKKKMTEPDLYTYIRYLYL